MTLLQLRILIAVERFGNLTEAADFCKSTPSTLSTHIKNAEEELRKQIFDRGGKKFTVTPFGRKYLEKAKSIVRQTEELEDLVNEDTDCVSGNINLSIGSTIAPYLVPKLITIFRDRYPSVNLRIEESRVISMLQSLKDHTFDIAIEISGLKKDMNYPSAMTKDLLEINLFHEKYYMYGGCSCNCTNGGMKSGNVNYDNMYIMPGLINSDACCIGNKENKGKYIYSSGSIDNLIRIVDQNRGYTLIPELHLQFLSDIQRTLNVSECDENHTPYRDISIYISPDFARESLINALVDAIKEIIPEHMIDERLKKKRVKL